MAWLLGISLGVNYVFVALAVLVVTAEYDINHAAWTEIAFLWPVTVPLLLVRRLVRKAKR